MLTSNYDIIYCKMYLQMWWERLQTLSRGKKGIICNSSNWSLLLKIREEEWTHTPESEQNWTRVGWPRQWLGLQKAGRGVVLSLALDG